jgi:hypothetical protein
MRGGLPGVVPRVVGPVGGELREGVGGREADVVRRCHGLWDCQGQHSVW